MPIQEMGSVQEQSTPEQCLDPTHAQETYGVVGPSSPRFAPLRLVSRRFALSVAPSFRSALFRFLDFSARLDQGWMESLQVQQSVSWILMGLGGGRSGNFSPHRVAHMSRVLQFSRLSCPSGEVVHTLRRGGVVAVCTRRACNQCKSNSTSPESAVESLLSVVCV